MYLAENKICGQAPRPASSAVTPSLYNASTVCGCGQPFGLPLHITLCQTKTSLPTLCLPSHASAHLMVSAATRGAQPTSTGSHCFLFWPNLFKYDPLVVLNGNTLGVTFPEIRPKTKSLVVSCGHPRLQSTRLQECMTGASAPTMTTGLGAAASIGVGAPGAEVLLSVSGVWARPIFICIVLGLPILRLHLRCGGGLPAASQPRSCRLQSVSQAVALVIV